MNYLKLQMWYLNNQYNFKILGILKYLIIHPIKAKPYKPSLMPPNPKTLGHKLYEHKISWLTKPFTFVCLAWCFAMIGVFILCLLLSYSLVEELLELLRERELYLYQWQVIHHDPLLFSICISVFLVCMIGITFKVKFWYA